MSKPDVTIGSVWDDRDPRSAGRTVEVMDIVGDRAMVRMNTPARNVSKSAIGRRTRVRLEVFGSRYKPSDEPARRFGADKDTGELGYWPMDRIDWTYLEKDRHWGPHKDTGEHGWHKVEDLA